MRDQRSKVGTRGKFQIGTLDKGSKTADPAPKGPVLQPSAERVHSGEEEEEKRT
jgi:hypothetical protein